MGRTKSKSFILLLLTVEILASMFFLDSANYGNDAVQIVNNQSTEKSNEKNSVPNLITSQIVNDGSFSDDGIAQNVSLYYVRNNSFKNNKTSDGGITIANSIAGWNMTNFKLNFTELSTTGKYVSFETRVDSGNEFTGDNYSYAASFKIPNTCYIRNLSMFIQYFGGAVPGGDNSEFTIRIYNSTIKSGNLEPHKPLDGASDKYRYVLNLLEYGQPVKWYQSNFTNILLNISRTKNNTFFAVFNALYVPSKPSLPESGYIFYANAQPTDQYQSIFLKRYSFDPWSKLTGKNAMLKVNLDPLMSKPNPTQVNLTVFTTPVVASGTYTNNSFIPHTNNEFYIPITSPWFADVYYNVSFVGNFKYNTYSLNTYNASEGKDVLWNSTLDIAQFPSISNFYNKSVRFYKPGYWRYNCTYNNTKLFNDTSKIKVKTNYVELLNISNDKWNIHYNQTNIILSKSIKSSSDQTKWYPVQNFVNITDYLNVSAQLNSSNGIGKLRIKTNSDYLTVQQQISSTSLNFPLWSPDVNTTAVNNNTKIEIQIMISNGTAAGIDRYSFYAILSKLNIGSLGYSSVVLKNNMAYYNFSIKSLYTSANISIDNLIVKSKKGSGQWGTLVKDYHYIILNPTIGAYNISIYTDLPSFLADHYLINFTFTKQYYFNQTVSFDLYITERSHNITVLGANNPSRTFTLGDQAVYRIYINDTITHEGIIDSNLTIWANFSGSKTALATNSYTIDDFNDGNYNITIFTDILFFSRALQNLSLEFRSQKTGIYSKANCSDILTFVLRLHQIKVVEVNRQNRHFTLGDQAIYRVYLNDSITDVGIAGSNISIWANFSAGKAALETNSYIIQDFHNGYYNITIFTNILFISRALENLSLEFRSLKINIYSLANRSDILTFVLRLHQITVVEVNKQNRHFTFGEQAIYRVYLNDSITDVGIAGSNISIWANFSTGKGALETNSYIVQDFHNGYYNITIFTSILFFNRILENLSLEFRSHKTYIYSMANQSDILTFVLRLHQITVVGVNNPSRTFTLGDQAIYRVYLNDSITGVGIVNSEISIWANFSASKAALASTSYTVQDFNNGTYSITIFTDVLFISRALEDLTLEFRSHKTYIYSTAICSDILTFVLRLHYITVISVNNPSKNFTLGDKAIYRICLNDTITNGGIAGSNISIWANFSTGKDALGTNSYTVQDFHNGYYNITIFTDILFFSLPLEDLTLEFRSQKTYIYSMANQSDILTFVLRLHNITIVGVNKVNRIFALGDRAIYSIYLNDSITGASIIDSEFSIWVNFSGLSREIDQNSYTIKDFNNGNYNITIFTDILFSNRLLENLSIEFRSQKTYIYSIANCSDILKIYRISRNTMLIVLSNSSNSVIYGKNPWILLQFYDVEPPIKNLTHAQFTIKNGSNIIDSYKYLIIEHLENDYNISFLLDKLNVGTYILRIEANYFGGFNITYLASYIYFNLTYKLANFTVEFSPPLTLYPDMTTNTTSLNITYQYGHISDVTIDIYLGPNKLALATVSPGTYAVFLDTRSLNMTKKYNFSITIKRTKFNDYVNMSFSVYISPFLSEILIPEAYQNITIYQEQPLEVVVLLKDIIRDLDILNAHVRMKFVGSASFSEYFTPISSDFGWYLGVLETGNIDPDKYTLFIEMTASNYLSNNITMTITILERGKTKLSLVGNFTTQYAWGDVVKIAAKLTTENNRSISGKIIIFEITELYENGNTKKVTLYGTTGNDGIAKVEYLVNEIASFKVKISFEGSVDLRVSVYTSDSAVDVLTTTEKLLIEFIPFIPIIVSAVGSVTAYKIVMIKKKQKQIRIWKEKEMNYNEILNINYLLIISKRSGIPIVQDDLGNTGFDATLVSGFLQAITAFIYGLQQKAIDGQEKSDFVFDHQDYKILLKDGENIRFALILNKEPSDDFKNQVTIFIKKFEEKYGQLLIEYKGIKDPFNDYLSLSDEKFPLTLRKPHIINEKRPTIKINPFQYNILSIAKTFEIIREKYLSISELREYLISALREHSIEEITATLLDLINMKFFLPVFNTEQI